MPEHVRERYEQIRRRRIILLLWVGVLLLTVEATQATRAVRRTRLALRSTSRRSSNAQQNAACVERMSAPKCARFAYD